MYRHSASHFCIGGPLSRHSTAATAPVLLQLAFTKRSLINGVKLLEGMHFSFLQRTPGCKVQFGWILGMCAHLVSACGIASIRKLTPQVPGLGIQANTDAMVFFLQCQSRVRNLVRTSQFSVLPASGSF